MKINGTCLTMVKNDSEAILVSLRDSAGLPVNFAVGDVVYLTIAEINQNTGALTQIYQFSTTLASVTHEATINIPKGGTASLSANKRYKYDIQWSSVAGRKTIIPYSDFNVIAEVTTNG